MKYILILVVAGILFPLGAYAQNPPAPAPQTTPITGACINPGDPTGTDSRFLKFTWKQKCKPDKHNSDGVRQSDCEWVCTVP